MMSLNNIQIDFSINKYLFYLNRANIYKIKMRVIIIFKTWMKKNKTMKSFMILNKKWQP